VLLTGKRISAAEAYRFGLDNEVVPRADLDAAVTRWVDDVLACAPLSVRAIKQVVRRTAQPLAAQGARPATPPHLPRPCSRKTHKEGVRAFIEKRKPVWQGEVMPYVITDACIDVKDKTCLDACPVDCIYEGGRTLYIQPEECIDAGCARRCVRWRQSTPDDRLPEELKPWLAVNAEFFGPEVTGWGRPGGADAKFTTKKDHPTVASWPRK
jgi:ferredoxin